ncbi:hypothetical protein EYC84_002159 [Monilinia fructicola]|uniref:Sm domain-containing protein n=1 Tax=Monilinia fructicola TaxID=38448 RepID=A0A5M9JPU2_MONFR|nr:hypothetical protein EYC84_002159 [Monilinia fructicola]
MTSPGLNPDPEVQEPPARKQARIYLHNLISKTLLVHTTDNRMFRGNFKCTDSDLNIILSETYEYRIPPFAPQFPPPPSSTNTSTTPTSPPSTLDTAADLPPSPTPTKPLIDIAPRWLGLVVVPGEHIVRIELEEFESQVRERKTAGTSMTDPLVKGKEISI